MRGFRRITPTTATTTYSLYRRHVLSVRMNSHFSNCCIRTTARATRLMLLQALQTVTGTARLEVTKLHRRQHWTDGSSSL